MRRCMENPAAGDDGALDCLAWRLDASDYNLSPQQAQPPALALPERLPRYADRGPRFRRGPLMNALATIGGKTPSLLGPNECVALAIRVELGERDRDGVPVAACSIATVEGTAAPICSLARELLRLVISPNIQLSIWRARTKCFHDLPVSRWAELTVKEGKSSPVFAPYVPFSGIPVAAQSAESDG